MRFPTITVSTNGVAKVLTPGGFGTSVARMVTGGATRKHFLSISKCRAVSSRRSAP